MPNEIALLKDLWTRHQISLDLCPDEFLGGDTSYPKLQVNIDGLTFFIFVDNEYEDLQHPNILLHLGMVLQSLVWYKEAEDYLVWCNLYGVDPADTVVRAYHMALGTLVPKLELHLGNITSPWSDYDFALNAGTVQQLRREKFQ